MSKTSTSIRPHGLATALLLACSLCCAGPAQEQSVGGPFVDLPFSEFFKRPIGPRGLEPSAALLAAAGRPVRLKGYMVAREQGAPGRFMLTPRPVRLSEHADGEADDLPPATVTVLLDASQRHRIVAHQAGLLALTGLLQVGRAEDSDGRVSWFRLQLDPDALAREHMPQASSAAHRHP